MEPKGRKAVFLIAGFFLLLVLLVLPSETHAASRYWVGSAGGNTSDTANWSATSGNACGVGGGASVPGTSDIAVFNTECDNSATINANLDVAGIDINTGYTGTITQNTLITVTVGASDYNQADGTFAGGDAAIDINDPFILSGGTFTSTSGTMTVDDSFTISGSPTFDANGGTVTFDGSGGATLACNNVTFNATTINKDAVNSTVTINSDCNLPLGADPTVTSARATLVLNGTLTGTGTLTLNNTNSAGSFQLNAGAVLSGFDGLAMTGTNAHNFIIAGATFNAGSYTTFDLDYAFTLSSGSFTAPSGTMTVGGSFTISGGTFDANGGTVTFDTSADPDINCGTETLAGIIINNASKTWTMTANCTVGDFTLTAGTVANPASAYTLSVQGDFAQNANTTFGGANLTVEFSGSANQAISKTTGTFSSPFQVNKTGGTASLSTDLTVTTEACDIVEGTFDINGKAFTCGGTFTVQDGGTLELFGAESLTPVLNSGSTVTFTGNGDSGATAYTISDLASTFHHLTFNSTDGADDTFLAPAGTLTVAGNFTNTAGTFTHNSGTVNLSGTSQTIAGSTTFNNLTKSVTTADTLTFPASATQTIAGTTTLTGQPGAFLALASSTPGTQWKFNPQGTRSISYATVSDSRNTNSKQVVTEKNNITDGGNNTGWAFPTGSDRLSPPEPPLGGFQILINKGEPTTTSPEVTLTFKKGADVTMLAVSDLPDVSNASIGRFEDTLPWNICASAREQHNPPDCEAGTYQVYAKLYTEYLLPTPVVSATVEYEKPQEEGASSPAPEEPTVEPEPEEEIPAHILRLLSDALGQLQALITSFQSYVDQLQARSVSFLASVVGGLGVTK